MNIVLLTWYIEYGAFKVAYYTTKTVGKKINDTTYSMSKYNHGCNIDLKLCYVSQPCC